MTGSGSNDDSLDEPLPPGTVVAERYRIEGLLGEGGMGRVYSALHVHLRKRVALKVLHPSLSHNPELVARFEREAMAAAGIEHPNIAAGTDLGTLDSGALFLVLELVSGRTLRSELAAGPLEARRAVRIVRSVAAAIAAAHAKGIIHRDLKPENVMLVERAGDPDFVKVLDFGIAKTVAVDERSGATVFRPLTRAGSVLGTPDYMPPEQALGEPVDARSDLYSIGIVLYELLTGERPFRGELIDLLRQQILATPAPLPASVAAAVGPELAVLLARVLAKSPADRPPTASAFLDALDRAVLPQALRAPARTPPVAATLPSSLPPNPPAGPTCSAPPAGPARSAPPVPAARPAAWRLAAVGIAAALTLAGAIAAVRHVGSTFAERAHGGDTASDGAMTGTMAGLGGSASPSSTPAVAAPSLPPPPSPSSPASPVGAPGLSANAAAASAVPASADAPLPAPPPAASATAPSARKAGRRDRQERKDNAETSGRSVDANAAGIHIHVALPEKLMNRLR